MLADIVKNEDLSRYILSQPRSNPANARSRTESATLTSRDQSPGGASPRRGPSPALASDRSAPDPRLQRRRPCRTTRSSGLHGFRYPIRSYHARATRVDDAGCVGDLDGVLQLVADERDLRAPTPGAPLARGRSDSRRPPTRTSGGRPTVDRRRRIRDRRRRRTSRRSTSARNVGESARRRRSAKQRRSVIECDAGVVGRTRRHAGMGGDEENRARTREPRRVRCRDGDGKARATRDFRGNCELLAFPRNSGRMQGLLGNCEKPQIRGVTFPLLQKSQ